ncbi:serine/threonine-protein kinase [Streptomyces sp. SL13]|uniref:Serine/threonine-protein kinase n=1 Tax=Streptantibioticus silvisoli TaxID=2705255 RepID=A0AA90JZQ8_9ACTN|nr:serine/threonine-protein kinase [Streptantibioticus silvisoli]MDI5966571.1 serine/threonine-protein kinase [Streptantibioticus silvisoli]MDI5972281.1 serine/threonine-protein kinase [Streptantibioticus silvisoli]
MDRTRGRGEAAGDGTVSTEKNLRQPDIGSWVEQAETGNGTYGGPGHEAEPLPGRLPDGYRMLRRIGSGRHSTVVLCRDEETGAEVALKMLHLTVPDENARLAAHAELLSAGAASRHPCSALVEDAGFTTDHHPFLVTQFCRGGNAQNKLSNSGRFPVDEVVVIGVRLALSLASAHRRGVLHLDVRPSNVLFDESGDALLTDHGVARVVQRSAPQVGAVFDPMYAAREMFGWENPGPSADVYGLGATLYALLNGLPAYADAGSTSWSALYSEVLRGELPHPDRHDVPPGLFDVIRRMMSVNPEGRPPLTEVHRELRLVLPPAYAGRVPALDPEPAPEPMLPGWDPADDVTPEEQAEAERLGREAEVDAKRRHRRMLIAGGAALVVFAGGATAMTLFMRHDKPKPAASVTLPAGFKQVSKSQLPGLLPHGAKAVKNTSGVQVGWTPPQQPGSATIAVVSEKDGKEVTIQQKPMSATSSTFTDSASEQPGVCFVVASVLPGKNGGYLYAAAPPACPTVKN